MDDPVLCINSSRHIVDGEAMIDVVDDRDGDLAGINGVHCPMCLQLVGMDLCGHGKTVGFHYKEHIL